MPVDGDSEGGRSSVKGCTPFHRRCQFDCIGNRQTADGAPSWRSEPQTVLKRQLDLNIVLSNYIKHRLGKDD